MSDIKVTRPYIYQPEPVNSTLYPRIYGISGPGTFNKYDGKRYTKEEAQKILDEIVKETSEGY